MNRRFVLLIYLLVLILIMRISKTEQVYRKITHTTDPQAKCLDGSPPAFYIHQGTQTDKFLLYFIGGGFCGVNTLAGTLEDCYQRSKTQFGSSNLWPETITDQTGAEGLISLNQTRYKNWTKVLFAYCDGALHQGNNMNPIQYKDTKLYFRGNRITRANFKYLIDNYQMDKASKILLSGGSAGAVASIVWGNYLQTIVQNPNNVYNVPDCGIFLNVPAFKTNFPQIQTRIANVMKLAYGDEQTPLQECNIRYPGQEWRCIFLEHNYPYLKGKMLFVESEYDSWAISNILLIKCVRQGTSAQTLKYCSSQQLEEIQNYRTKYTTLMNQKVRTDTRGTWSLACAKHCYLTGQSYNSELQKIPAKTGLTPEDTIFQFVINNNINWSIDSSPWPSNQPCAY